MKRIAALATLIASVALAQAAYVQGYVEDITGVASSPLITFQPESTPLIGGSGVVLDVSRNVRPVSGYFSNYLAGGVYTVRFGSGGGSVSIAVPADNNVYWFTNLIDLATFTYPSIYGAPSARFLPGIGASFTTNNAGEWDESLTVGLSPGAGQGTVTNAANLTDGAPVVGNGTDGIETATTFSATYLSNGTLNSNKLDAATLALIVSTNGLASEAYVDTATNDLHTVVTAEITAATNTLQTAVTTQIGAATNGLASESYVNNATNDFATVAASLYQPLDADLTTLAGNNGINLTNLDGGNIQAGTVNSNALDAATLSLFGSGGGIASLVEDTTPQLGGNLDLNGNVITGLEIGTDVQAYDADLSTWAGISPSANLQTYLGTPSFANWITLLALSGTPDGTKFLRDDGSFQSIPGGGDLLAANNLSDVASVATARANLGANNAANLTTGTLPTTRLSASVPLVDAASTITSDWVNTAYPWADNEVSDTLTVGSGGSVDDGALSANVPLLDAAGNIFSGEITADGVTANTFTGAGSGLTALNASALASGTLADGRLSSNVPLKNAANTFSTNQTIRGQLYIAHTNQPVIDLDNFYTGSSAFAGMPWQVNSSGAGGKTLTGVHLTAVNSGDPGASGISVTGLKIDMEDTSDGSSGAGTTQNFIGAQFGGTITDTAQNHQGTYNLVGVYAKSVETDGGSNWTATNRYSLVAEDDVLLETGKRLYFEGAYNGTTLTPGDSFVSYSGGSLGFTVDGTERATITSSGISGDGGGLTGLNATQLTSGTVPDARFPATLPAVSGANLTSLDDDAVAFDDANSDYTATAIGPAIEELASVNGSGVNSATAKVDWSQLGNVPAGFADGTDDGGGGTTISNIVDSGTSLIITNGSLASSGIEVSNNAAGQLRVYGAVTFTNGSAEDQWVTLNPVGPDTISTFGYMRAVGYRMHELDQSGHFVTIAVGDNQTSDRLLSILMGDANQTLNLANKTGTGGIVLSASPTLTGTVGAEAITASGAISAATLSGAGSAITSIDGANLTAGTVLSNAVDEATINPHIENVIAAYTPSASYFKGSESVGASQDAQDATSGVLTNVTHSFAVEQLSDTNTPSVLTLAETDNKIISNYNSAGADHVFTMPAAHAAGNIIFVVGDEFQVDIEPNSGDNFYLNGTAMAADEHIQNTADTLGDTIVGMAVNINGTYKWMFSSGSANWVEETP